MELWQLHVSEPSSTKSLWAVWDAPVHLSWEGSAPGWQWSWAPIRRKGNWRFHRGRTNGTGAVCAHYRKNGEGFFPVLTHYRVRQKGILETGKGFSPERMYPEKPTALLWNPIEVTAEWPLFYKLEIWIIVWHVTVYADKLWIPIVDLSGYSSLKNQDTPPPPSMLFPIASYWRGQEEALRIWWAGVQNNRVICNCCFFQG